MNEKQQAADECRAEVWLHAAFTRPEVYKAVYESHAMATVEPCADSALVNAHASEVVLRDQTPHEWKCPSCGRSSRLTPAEWLGEHCQASVVAGHPACSGCLERRRGTSAAERELADLLAPHFEQVRRNEYLAGRVAGSPAAPDFFGIHNGFNVVVEYDGERFHSSSGQASTDAMKTVAYLRRGYAVVRVREGGLGALTIGVTDQALSRRLLQIEHRREAPLDDVRRRICHWVDALEPMRGRRQQPARPDQ